MNKKINWGVIGSGGIAKRRTIPEGIIPAEHANLVSVYGTNQSTNNSVAEEFNAIAVNSIHELINSGIDAVYIASPVYAHLDQVIECAEGKKHILCEKPMAVNASQVKQMIKAAQSNKVFLMEAMWTRFLPMMAEVRDIIEKGTIGQPQLLYADFGVNFDYDPQSRIFNPNLAGGALLDLGIYCLALASMIFGKSKNTYSTIKMAKTGVDERSTIVLEYDNAKVAILFQALDLETPREALIIGTEGSIKLHPHWMSGSEYTLKLNNGTEKRYKANTHENGFIYEIMAVHKSLNAGKTQCDLMSHDETLAITETMDAIRSQWGFKYPFE